ncbi:Odorant receptor Or106 [Rhyzopertha dominica]|nr:Odorant receptor Or106 [Rhyzopertha dominica]
MVFTPKPMEEDYLPLFKKVTLLYYDNLYVRLLCKIYLFVFFVVHLLQMIKSALDGWRPDHWYNTLMLTICVHELVTVFLVERVHDEFISLRSLMYEIFWSPKEAPLQLIKNYQKLYQTFKAILILGLLAIIIFCYGSAKFHTHPEWPMVAKNSSTQYSVFFVAFLIQALAAYIIVYIYSFMFFYVCIHGRIQMELLIEYLKQISKELQHCECRHLDAITKDRFIVIVKQHLRLSRYVEQVNNTFGGRRLTLPLMTSMVSFSICLYAVYQDQVLTLSIFLIVFFALPSVYCVAGELLSSGFEKFSLELYNTRWYIWNKENKQTFSLFLPFAAKVQVVDVLFPPLTVRVSTILWTIRTLYSLLTVMNSINTKNRYACGCVP